MPALIQACNVSVHHRGKAILDTVSLSISAGEFVTIVGPNGAGKSLLIKCLLGIHTPDTGQVSRLASLRTGYVPQRINIDPSMPISVTDFLLLNSRVNAAQRQQRLKETAQETDIENLLAKPLNTLSGGEMQRVLLARALKNSPDLLVLDEPTQNLDISGEIAFYQLVERIFKTRKPAILMVSHDLHWVMASTQKVVCLYHHICCSGSPQKVAQHPEFISLFGQDLSSLMAAYPHQHNHQHKH